MRFLTFLLLLFFVIGCGEPKSSYVIKAKGLPGNNRENYAAPYMIPGSVYIYLTPHASTGSSEWKIFIVTRGNQTKILEAMMNCYDPFCMPMPIAKVSNILALLGNKEDDVYIYRRRVYFPDYSVPKGKVPVESRFADGNPTEDMFSLFNLEILGGLPAFESLDKKHRSPRFASCKKDASGNLTPMSKWTELDPPIKTSFGNLEFTIDALEEFNPPPRGAGVTRTRAWQKGIGIVAEYWSEMTDELEGEDGPTYKNNEFPDSALMYRLVYYHIPAPEGKVFEGIDESWIRRDPDDGRLYLVKIPGE